jgi:hypothetical protein
LSNAEQILSSFSGFCRFQSDAALSCQEMKTIALQSMLSFLLLGLPFGSVQEVFRFQQPAVMKFLLPSIKKPQRELWL